MLHIAYLKLFRKANEGCIVIVEAVKDQNNLEKKPTKKQLKGDFWHEKNMAGIAAFQDLL